MGEGIYLRCAPGENVFGVTRAEQDFGAGRGTFCETVTDLGVPFDQMHRTGFRMRNGAVEFTVDRKVVAVHTTNIPTQTVVITGGP